jgi:hypothetical protein
VLAQISTEDNAHLNGSLRIAQRPAISFPVSFFAHEMFGRGISEGAFCETSPTLLHSGRRTLLRKPAKADSSRPAISSPGCPECRRVLCRMWPCSAANSYRLLEPRHMAE